MRRKKKIKLNITTVKDMEQTGVLGELMKTRRKDYYKTMTPEEFKEELNKWFRTWLI